MYHGLVQGDPTLALEPDLVLLFSFLGMSRGSYSSPVKDPYYSSQGADTPASHVSGVPRVYSWLRRNYL